jgi:hypothetical protein
VINSLLDDDVTNVNSLLLAGSAIPNSIITVFDGETLFGTAQADPVEPLELPDQLTNGLQGFTVTATLESH